MSFSAFLRPFCKRYRIAIGGSLLCSFLWACSVSLNPWLLKQLIDQEDRVFWAACYTASAFGVAFLFRIYDWIHLRLFPALKREILEEGFSLLQRHSYPYFQKHSSGNLGQTVSDLSKQAANILRYLLDQILARFLAFCVGVFTLATVHGGFALLFTGWASLFLGVSIFLLKKSESRAAAAAQSWSVAVGEMIDSIANIFSVKSYARADYEKQHVQKGFETSQKQEERLLWFLMGTKIVHAVLLTALMAATFSLLLYAYNRRLVTPGDFAMIVTLVTVLSRDIFWVTTQLVQFSEQVGVCKRALSLLSEHEPLSLKKPLQVTEGEIVFQNISFGYNKELFIDQSVVVAPGSKIGIAGLSGSGKTTFVNLVLRLFELQKGAILIDGQDIRDLDLDSLRKAIALIPQEPLLFRRTILENIRYGNPEATLEEVKAAAHKAHCHFIDDLPEGYNSIVGERGLSLSGGQRQRIAIARAILKNAPILILDEATSALDAATESAVQESFSHLLAGKTALVISHRPSTLQQMDRILVLHEGKIVEEGAHEALLQKRGRYASMFGL